MTKVPFVARSPRGLNFPLPIPHLFLTLQPPLGLVQGDNSLYLACLPVALGYLAYFPTLRNTDKYNNIKSHTEYSSKQSKSAVLVPVLSSAFGFGRVDTGSAS